MKLMAVPVTSKMGMVETAVAPNAERAGVCLVAYELSVWNL
jgi:hypothetical protein